MTKIGSKPLLRSKKAELKTLATLPKGKITPHKTPESGTCLASSAAFSIAR
jgi:hypothetical protein